MFSGKNQLKIMEVALLVGLAVSLLWGVWSLQEQDDLQGKMIRLHVLANSDSAEDQSLKLEVRDRVLRETAGVLEASHNAREAQVRFREALPDIERAAEEVIRDEGYAYDVEARLEAAEFPTRVYDGFSLPAGQYLALRVLIGEAAGHNWWCVVYPPLCTAAATDLEETAVCAGMAAEDVALMQENEGYELKFKSVELWEDFRQWLQKE